MSTLQEGARQEIRENTKKSNQDGARTGRPKLWGRLKELGPAMLKERKD